MKSSPSLNLINLTDIMGKSNLINCVSYLNWDYRSSSSHVFIINAETTTCDVLPPSIPVSSSLLEPEPIPRSTDTNRAVAVVLYALRRDDSSFRGRPSLSEIMQYAPLMLLLSAALLAGW